MDKYLLIEFKNAGVFYNNFSKINDMVVYSKLDPTQNFKKNIVIERRKISEIDRNNLDIIRKHLVKNLLHVFLNKRPVPEYRPVCYNYDDNILNMCDDEIYVKHKFLKTNSLSDNNIDYCIEMKKLNKSQWNSWVVKPYPRWEFINECLQFDKENYYKLISILYEEYNIDISKNTLMETNKYFIENPEKGKELFDICKLNNLNTSIIKFINGTWAKGDKFSMRNDKFGSRNVTSGISKGKYFEINDKIYYEMSYYFTFDGHLIVKVNDKYLDELDKQGKSYATFLDGGMARIVKIIPEYKINTSDYIKL